MDRKLVPSYKRVIFAGQGADPGIWKMVAGTVYVDYISDRNTGDPGLEDVCGPLNLDGIHCIVSGSSMWAGYLGSLFIG
jgi:hypothetical protein